MRILLLLSALAALAFGQSPVVRSNTLQAGTPTYCSDGGANDTYTCTVTPTLTAYTTGMVVIFKPNTANTGAATLNIDAIGAKAIVTAANVALSDNDLVAGRFYSLYYDGTSLRMHQDLTAAAANHNLFSASHLDTVVQTATRGSLLYGNATPLWDELVIGAAKKALFSDGTDVLYQFTRLRSHATDCTALTDGNEGEACYEQDADTLYICEPTAGACDTAGEWRLVTGAGSGDSVSVNGVAAGDANFINTAASGTVPSITWSLNTTPSPDEISISAIGAASATQAGVLTTGAQTIAGDKTLNGLIDFNTSSLVTAVSAPVTPAAGKGALYLDSTSKNISIKDDAGVIKHGVQTRTATASNWIRAIDAAGLTTISQPGFTDISGVATKAQAPAAVAYEDEANTFTSVQTVDVGTTPAQALFVSIAAPGVAGTRDSHFLDHRGASFDTGAHTADWRWFVDVTTNAGGSTYTLQSRIDAAAFANRITVTDGSVVTATTFVGALTGNADTATTASLGDSATAFFSVGTLENARLDADLTALGDNATNGIWARTGAGTGSARTVTGTADEISVANGDGVAGNPTLSLPAILTLGGKTLSGGSPLVFEGLTVDTFETTLVVTDPTAARTFTLPNANSVAVQPDTGAANNFLTAVSALGVVSKAQPAFTNLSGNIGVTQMRTIDLTREVIFMLGADNGAALADTDDQPTFFSNRLGGGITITEVWCESDAGTPIINLQRDDGTPANVLSANLTCSTTGATGTIDVAEDNVANTEKLDFVMVTAGGTAKRATVVVKFTVD